MSDAYSPTARRRRLSAELRQLREATGRTAADVARTLDWPRSKLTRIEQNQWKRPSLRDVKDLLDQYEVTDDDRRERLLELTRQGRVKGWWTQYSDVFGPAEYIGLEAEASAIRTWQPLTIPGLLQTRDYAAAMVRGGDIRDPEEVERRVEARMARQAVLVHENPPHIWAVLDEAAARKPVGGEDVFQAQLRHLLDVTQHEHITVQVVRDEAGAHAAMGGAFVLLDFPAEGDQPVVYLETLTEGLILEEADRIDRYSWLFHHVSAVAMSPADTVEYLKSKVISKD